MTTTHHQLAHRLIDRDIDNLADELHDRALDDFADMIDDYIPALRSLAYARHDIACSLTITIDADLDDIAFDTDDDALPCITESLAMIAPLYSFYRD